MTLAFTPIASNPARYLRIRCCHLKLLFGKMYVCLLDFCNIINQLAKVFLKLILLRGIFFLRARCSYPQFLFCYRFYSSLYCIFVITEGMKSIPAPGCELYCIGAPTPKIFLKMIAHPKRPLHKIQKRC